MNKEIICRFKEKCVSYPSKCDTCVNNEKRDYYTPNQIYPYPPYWPYPYWWPYTITTEPHVWITSGTSYTFTANNSTDKKENHYQEAPCTC